MTSLRPKDLGSNIVKLSGVNLFDNTRKRKNVQYRALLCFLLREKLLMRWTNIANFFESQGKKMDHAGAIYLVKMYPIYKKENPLLDEIENMFIFKSHLNYDEIDKVHYLENKYNNMEKKYLTLVEKMNDPIIKEITSLPDDRIEDVKEKLSILKKSWIWKQKQEL